MDLTAALTALRDRNAADPDVDQGLGPAEPLPRGVPTLKEGVYRPLTPQLRERFAFAGDWAEAWINQTWLGPAAMERAWTDPGVRAQIAQRTANWEGALAVPAARLTLFGIQRDDHDETYLVWPEQDGAEPRVIEYFGHNVDEYGSLEEYLAYILG